MPLTYWSRDRRTLHLSLHVPDHSGVVLEVDEDALLLVPRLPLTDHHHEHHRFPKHRLALLHEARAHDVNPRRCDLVQAASDALHGHDGKVLVAVLSAQFMTPIPTFILNLASSWSLSWTRPVRVLNPGTSLRPSTVTRWSLPAVGYALFTRCGSALFTCRRFLLVLLWTPLVLVWTNLCPLPGVAACEHRTHTTCAM